MSGDLEQSAKYRNEIMASFSCRCKSLLKLYFLISKSASLCAVYLSVSLSNCLSVVCLSDSTYISFCCLSIYWSVCLSIYLLVKYGSDEWGTKIHN